MTFGLYQYKADEVRVQWKSGREAIGGWSGACAGAWKPTRLQQEDQELIYPDGNWTYAYANLRCVRSRSSLAPAAPYILPICH